jgi:hypothetical protein
MASKMLVCGASAVGTYIPINIINSQGGRLPTNLVQLPQRNLEMQAETSTNSSIRNTLKGKVDKENASMPIPNM